MALFLFLAACCALDAAAAQESAPAPRAAPAATVETLSTEMRGTLKGLRADPGKPLSEATLEIDGGSVPLGEVIRIAFDTSPGIPREIVATLADGARLRGGLGPECDDSNLHLSGGLFPEGVKIPLEWVRRIDFIPAGTAQGPTPAGPAPAGEDDTLALRDGGLLTGVIERIDAKGVALEDKKLGSVEHEWSRISHVTMTALGAAPRHPEKTLVATVEGDEGSTFSGALLALDGGEARLRSALFGEQRLPIARLRSIELDSGRVRYLSAADPVRAVEGNPYIQPETFARVFRWRRDASVNGGPITIGSRGFRRGLGVQSESRLTFAVEGADRLFQCWVGIDASARPPDDDPRLASVVFKVRVDGEEKYNSGELNWQSQPQRVEVRVEGAKELELIVEMGAGLHIRDQADWADARILRE